MAGPLRVPTKFGLDWYRKVADAVNQLIGRGVAADETLATAVLKDGTTIYAGDTAGASYDQTKMQALMDAVEAISDRLE